MLRALLLNRHVFAVLTAVLTAALASALSHVTERDRVRTYRTFFKTLVSCLAAGMAVAWLASPGTEPLATEPFDVAAAAPPPSSFLV